ncbi:unnamed protein product [Clonostachys rhizophaga]|uniref:AB hydrolase-1 domain-containing protein n=1 Tax=Clonostachys rhizophaga TaxID=160324 RepID=A0A9N9YQE7_9HYPO|nr:unnamed protein product [Clonostachys rhizophaga]
MDKGNAQPDTEQDSILLCSFHLYFQLLRSYCVRLLDKMLLFSAFYLSLAGMGVIAATTRETSNCVPVSFHFSVSALNTVWLSPPDPGSETSILDFFYSGLANGTGPAVAGTTKETGTFQINGIYCSPTREKSGQALQVLVHGITYDKSIWSGTGYGAQYDWQAFATNQGYHTLAIDRLGHGSNPERPDPLAVVQGSFHIEMIHKLISIVRNQSGNPLGRTFNKVVYVSHSYGGWVGTGLIARYPKDVDAMVLTGFSTVPNFAPFANSKLRSAALLAPGRFPGLPLGYITFGESSGRKAAFFAGNFDPAFPALDYASQETWTIGETGSLGFTSTSPVDYTGPLFLATGADDAIFCQPPKTACEALVQNSKQFYPNVKKFGFFVPENTGHTLTRHYSAPATFAKVHRFLNEALGKC